MITQETMKNKEVGDKVDVSINHETVEMTVISVTVENECTEVVSVG